MVFENIKGISIKNQASWQDKIFLTFDVDWASDEVLSYTIDIVERYDIKATFFVTHKTKLLKRLRKNPKIEIGVHPNFNYLLKGDFRYGKNINEVIGYYKKIAPEARSVRSHSMTQSTEILNLFTEYNLKYDCNHFIPFNKKTYLKPWVLWDKKLIKVPYFWEDDIHCVYKWDWNHKIYTRNPGLKVFNFHPILIFLNLEKFSKYGKNKKYLNNFDKLSRCVNKKYYGIYNFLIDLIDENING